MPAHVAHVKTAPLRPPLRSERRGFDSRRAAETAANRAKEALAEARDILREQKRLSAVTAKSLPPWMRACWICAAPGRCQHREPELADWWQR